MVVGLIRSIPSKNEKAKGLHWMQPFFCSWPVLFLAGFILGRAAKRFQQKDCEFPVRQQHNQRSIQSECTKLVKTE